jgi:glycosyltransferase involved in cell wall biosynthesis
VAESTPPPGALPSQPSGPPAAHPDTEPGAAASDVAHGTVGPGDVAVVIPAKDEAERIDATVRAALTIPDLRHVLVVDDGSTDATARRAAEAGAVVLRHPRNRGKAAAMESGAARIATWDAAAGRPPSALLFVDADLGDTAARIAVLATPVLDGEADMTIAVLPRQRTAGGGRGFVVRLARYGIRQATGWTATQPLSGMRCLTREAFEAARPLARGWGVETALTIDLLSAGYRVLEVPCELHHRVTGRDLSAQLHRARQFRDVLRALAVRRVRRAVPLRALHVAGRARTVLRRGSRSAAR